MTSRASAAPVEAPQAPADVPVHRAPTDARMAPVAGVVLCGGRSTRMGFDKGAAELGGETLAARAARALAAVAGQVVLATGPQERYAELGLPRLTDDPELTGPAAGIVAALEGAGAERALVLACDMPRVDAALLGALLERALADDLDACLLESARGVEPLCGVYHARVAPAMRAAQRAGDLRVLGFRAHPRADGAPVRVGTVREPDPRADRARNLNTGAELLAERRRLAEGEGA